MSLLTNKKIQSWVKNGDPITGISDGNGLTFTLSKAGTASWVLRYRLGGKSKEVTLGRYPDLSLAEARKLAAERRVQVQQGIDVAATKQEKIAEARQRASFAELADMWLDHHVRKRHKHPRVTERVIERDLLPTFGKQEPTKITTGDITRNLAKITASGRPTIANDALRHLKSIFSYGEVLGIVNSNPADKIKIQHAGGVEKARERFLNQKELTLLFKSIQKAGLSFGRDNELSVYLLLCLGCRKMELFAAKWTEFDLEDRTWHLPGSRTKTGEPREVPLPPPVIEWLRELEVRACGSEFVFPSRRSSKRFGHVSPDTLWRALKSLDVDIEPFSVHDLRRSSRSLMSEIGVPFDVAEKILGHKLPGVAAIYDRGGSIQQQRVALEKIASLIQDLATGTSSNNVVTITPQTSRH